MKKILVFLLSMVLLFSVAACGSNGSAQVSDSTDSAQSSNSTVSAESDMFSTRDMDSSYDPSTASKITLANETVTITEEGVYILSGEIKNGQVIVEVPDTQTVQLVLDEVNISSATSAPIYIKSADKVFITLAENTKNKLSVTGEYAKDNENNVDGAIFSKSDLTFNGSGELNISATYGHGIVGKDDVVFTGGSYIIMAQKQGISANDSVRVADGSFSITSGKDGIGVENTQDTEKGFFYMKNGSVTIHAQGDAVSASGPVQIEGGTFSLKTGDGAQSVTLQKDSMDRQQNIPSQSTEQTDASVSQKGLKSDGAITINNGVFVIDTIDDGIHATGDIEIADGDFTLKSSDDAVHSDQAVRIENGSFNIPYCFEGIEGLSITINGGTFDIVSSDDGLNAAGGTDSSDLGGIKDPFATTQGAFITINGGTITIVSDGDSLDSNGDLTINGGTLNLTCNGNGNTAIDTSGTYSYNKGDVTTNDGSESGIQRGGPRPGGGAKPEKRN